MAAKKNEVTAEPRSFEKSLTRLEEIVAGMESGKLSLEDMIARFEEGRALVDLCTRKLNEVERKIEVLVKKGESMQAEPLDAEPEQELDQPDALDETEPADDELF